MPTKSKRNRKLKINRRKDEPEYPYSYQITFRTNRALSAAWSSLRGLCKKFGHDEKSPELFRTIVLPAMRQYVKPYARRAADERTISLNNKSNKKGNK